MQEGQAAFHAYASDLDEAGVLISAEVLQPSDRTTTLTAADGSARVQDGPYAETREQIGGTFVIDVADLDAALAWAEKCPAARCRARAGEGLASRRSASRARRTDVCSRSSPPRPDERLALLFVCAHPAIDAGIRTPLMLQTVLGFEARQIAGAFAVRPATMAQRLVRAKRRIRDARIPFAVPDRASMAARLPAVHEAIYGAYAIDWEVAAGPATRDSMAFEALHLATTLAELLPDDAETLGLAALLALSVARLPGRRPDGFVPLEQQDTTLWDAGLIRLGERLLRDAHYIGRPGRFQLEAAIQSVHCDRATTGITDWSALRKLYAALVDTAPTLGARVAHAATIARTDGPAAGLAALDEIDDPAMERFQPAWATRAHLLAELGRTEAAERAFARDLPHHPHRHPPVPRARV